MHLRDRGRKMRPKDVASIVTFVIYSCRTTRCKLKETIVNCVSCLHRCKIYYLHASRFCFPCENSSITLDARSHNIAESF